MSKKEGRFNGSHSTGANFFSTDPLFAGEWAVGSDVGAPDLKSKWFGGSGRGGPQVIPVVVSIKRLWDFKDTIAQDEAYEFFVNKFMSDPYMGRDKAWEQVERHMDWIKEGNWSVIEEPEFITAVILENEYEGFTIREDFDGPLNYGIFKQASDQGKVKSVFNQEFDKTDPKFSIAPSFEAGNYENSSPQDKRIWNVVKKWYRKQWMPGGLLPQAAFKLKVDRDNRFHAQDDKTMRVLGDFERAVKAAYGKQFMFLSEEQKAEIDDILHGGSLGNVPVAVRTAVAKMRTTIDALSTEYLKIIQTQIDELRATGKKGDERAAAKAEVLHDLIIENKGKYVTRSYRVFDDPRWADRIPDDVRQRALDYLTVQTEGDVQRAKEIIGVITQGSNTAYVNMESLIRESTLGAKDLTILMKRKNIAPEIRALMGENTDVQVNYARTMLKMTRLIWNTHFLNSLKEEGTGVFLFEDGKPRPPEASEQIAGEKSDVMSPLNGMWVTPEVKQAFVDALGRSSLPDWQGTLLGINGMIKYGKVVLSTATQVRNLVSAFYFVAQAGSLDIKQILTGAETVWEQVRATEGGTAKYYRHLVELGVLYDTPNAGMLQDLLDDGQNIRSAIEYHVESIAGKDIIKPAFATIKRYNDIIKRIYRGSDDFWKIVAFESQLSDYMEATGLSRGEAEPIVAKRVRDTIPTYSLTGSGMKKLGRFPIVGSFVAFASEILRTSANNLALIKSDLADPRLKKLAYKRIAGTILVHSWAKATMVLSAAMMGIDDDEEESIRKLGSPWAINADLLFWGRDDKGRLTTVDLSYIDPYNYFHRPVTALLRNADWEEKLSTTFKDVLGPFLGWDIATGAIYEAISNNKKSGGRIYNPDAPGREITAEIAEHLFFATGPGVLQNARGIYRALQGERNSVGKVYDLKDEVAGAFGLRFSTFDPKFSLYFRTGDFKEQIANSRTYLYRIAADINPVDQDDLTEAFETANDMRLRAYDDMLTFVNAARISGVSDSEIRRVLRASNVSKKYANALARGKEAPRWKIGKTFLKGATKRARLLIDRETAKELQARRRFVRAQALVQQP